MLVSACSARLPSERYKNNVLLAFADTSLQPVLAERAARLDCRTIKSLSSGSVEEAEPVFSEYVVDNLVEAGLLKIGNEFICARQPHARDAVSRIR